MAETGPSTADPEIQLARLIEDAGLVAGFGLRAGRLHDGKLLSALQAVRAEDPPNWGSKKVLALQQSLNDAVVAIRPVTLVDLRGGWDPFDPARRRTRAESAARYVFVVLALLMIGVAVYYSQWLKRAEAVIAVQEENLADQLDTLVAEINDRFLGPDSVLRAAADDAAADLAADNLRDMLRTAERTASARWSAYAEYNTVIDRYYRLQGVVLDRDPSLLWADYRKYRVRQARAPSSPPPLTDTNPCATRLLRLARGGPSDPVDASSVRAPAAATGGVAPPPPPLETFSARVAREGLGVTMIRCVINADRPPYGAEYDEAGLREKIEYVSLWFLPAVFGAFGALINQLRACLDRMRPDPRFGRSVLRIFLGAFGGIAFGWFWSPDATRDLLPPTLPLGAYAVAFMIGYSIDIFFALLDKLVATMSGTIEDLGRKAPAS